ncbi:hypothetical protein LCGC14_1737550, partial [marine sediment metagenome]
HATHGPVLVVDDVLTTGASMHKVADEYEDAVLLVAFARKAQPGVHAVFTQVTPREDELRGVLQCIKDYATPAHSNIASLELAIDGIFKAADDALSPREGAAQQEGGSAIGGTAAAEGVNAEIGLLTPAHEDDPDSRTASAHEGDKRRDKDPLTSEAQNEAAQPKAMIRCDHHDASEGQSTCPNCGQDVGVLRCKKTTTGQLSSKNYSPTPTVPPRRGRANRGVEEQECTSLVGTSYAPEISNRSQPVSQPATRVDRRVDEGSRPSQTGSRA